MNLHDTARETLLKAALALADRGFLAGVGGNLALRIDAAINGVYDYTFIFSFSTCLCI